MEFHDGKVRLINSGHGSVYDAGTYEFAGGKGWWHLPDYGLTLRLQLRGLELHAEEEKTGRSFSLQRSFRGLGWFGAPPQKTMGPLRSHASRFHPLYDAKPRL